LVPRYRRILRPSRPCIRPVPMALGMMLEMGNGASRKMVPPIRRHSSSGYSDSRIEPKPLGEGRDGLLMPPGEVTDAAGLSKGFASARNRTSHPSGSRRWGSRRKVRDFPGPWSHPAPQKVLELDRPRPCGRGTGMWLPRGAPALSGSRPAHGITSRCATPGRVHSGRECCSQAPILAPFPARIPSRTPFPDRRSLCPSSRNSSLSPACGPVPSWRRSLWSWLASSCKTAWPPRDTAWRMSLPR